jgi:hypothetical protein
MDEQKKCIFRFDTHGRSQPFEAACHVHLGEDEEICENGDGRLRDYSLEQIDFLEAYRLAHSKVNARRLPWEAE